MSVNTKNGSDNVSCATNTVPGSPITATTPEPKANHHMSGRSDTSSFPSLQNPVHIDQQNVRSSKVVRILTVIAYMIAVSMAAIILSIYYTFIWNPYAKMEHVPAQENTSSYAERSSPDFADAINELNTSPELPQAYTGSSSLFPHSQLPTSTNPFDESDSSSLATYSSKAPLHNGGQKIANEQMDLVTKFVLSNGPSAAVSSPHGHQQFQSTVLGERSKVNNLPLPLTRQLHSMVTVGFKHKKMSS